MSPHPPRASPRGTDPRVPPYLHLFVVADGLDGRPALQGCQGTARLQLHNSPGAAGETPQLHAQFCQLLLLLLWGQVWGTSGFGVSHGVEGHQNFRDIVRFF